MPAEAAAAQQELRPPKTWTDELNLGGRLRRQSRQRPPRLSRSFALPKPGPTNLTWEGDAPAEPAKAAAAQQELRPPKSRATELNLGGRGSGRAG